MWLLLRLSEGPAAAFAGHDLDEPHAVLAGHGLIDADDHVTDVGTAVLERLQTARAARIRALLDDWSPDRHPEILDIVGRLAKSFAEAPPEPRPSPAAGQIST
jgi:hypothetical protein